MPREERRGWVQAGEYAGHNGGRESRLQVRSEGRWCVCIETEREAEESIEKGEGNTTKQRHEIEAEEVSCQWQSARPEG